jgi:hypothetical protein
MIQINKISGVEYMSIDEFARWACLVEAFDFIAEKADQLGNDAFDFIKPSAFETYINERFSAMRYDVSVEYAMGNI